MLHHAAAERAAADARAAASKAMIEAERKEKAVAEALIEFERKDKAWNLTVQREEAARARMDAAEAQDVDEVTHHAFALAQEQHSQANLDFCRACVELSVALAARYIAAAGAAIWDANVADECEKAAVTQANIADIHVDAAVARGNLAEAALARERGEVARKEAREMHEEANRNREKVDEAQRSASLQRAEADDERRTVAEARTDLHEARLDVADARVDLTTATQKVVRDAADARAKAAEERCQDARTQSEVVDPGTATYWDLLAGAWDDEAEMWEAAAESSDSDAKVNYAEIQAAESNQVSLSS